MDKNNDHSNGQKTEVPNVIKLTHVPSSNFISDYASGALITGPTEEDMYFLTFFAECAFIEKETGYLIESKPDEHGNKEVSFNLGVDSADIKHFREDKARIILSKKTLLSLRELLIRHPI